MNTRPADSLTIALAQLNPTVGDVAGNADKVRRARDQAAAQGAELVALSRTVHRRLSARGPGAQAGVPGGLPRRRRGAGARERERPGRAGRHAVGRGRQALQRLCAAQRRRDRGGALQGRSAELRRVRREARVRAGADAGADPVQGRADRHSDLRGHLGRRGRRVPERDRRRNPAGAERLAVLARQDRAPAQHRGGARRRIPACRWSISTWSAARTNWCSTAPRSCSMPTARSARSFRRSARSVAITDWQRDAGGWRCAGEQAPAQVEEGDKADYAACVLGLRDYVEKNGFKGVVLGLSGGIDSALCAAMAADALGRAARALRDAAVSLHLAGFARRCGARAPRRWACTYDILPIEAAVKGLEAALAPAFAGAEARRHRGEPAGARARHHPDGASPTSSA